MSTATKTVRNDEMLLFQQHYNDLSIFGDTYRDERVDRALLNSTELKDSTMLVSLQCCMGIKVSKKDSNTGHEFVRVDPNEISRLFNLLNKKLPVLLKKSIDLCCQILLK
uniref:Uncharacterized protein n=1 Tax=Romanomermis culicivorax TaxID=13658 RepID=A0A915KRJ0_ROMCU